MAKNDKKNSVKPVEDEKRDTISAPEKVAELPAAEEKNTAGNQNKAAKPIVASTAKKSQSGRKFMLFILLLILVGGGAAVMHWRQLETQNAATLQNLQKTWENKVTALEIRLNEVEKDVSGLKNRPVVEQVAGVSENQVNQKLAVLREELLRQINSRNTDAAADASGETEAEEAPAPEKTLLAPEIVSLVAQERKTQEVLLASGAIIIRDLAEQGVPFAYEAEVLQILARGNELAENYARTIRSFSNSGISGKNQLIRDFRKIFADLNNTELKNQPVEEKLADDAKWTDKAIYWLKRAFVAQKTPERPQFTVQDDEVLNLVNEGRLNDALNALKTSEKYAKINSLPLNEWRAQTEKYLEFNSAISGLIMNALANIRLKEMEHSVQ
ncbi:MAG: hypothetical protein IKN71_07780 [Alphaproteobacteria bacterium]|nr:hypothetical protein [Alphaproteobacteria bacterium]